MQKHISVKGDQVAGVSLHSIGCQAFSLHFSVVLVIIFALLSLNNSDCHYSNCELKTSQIDSWYMR